MVLVTYDVNITSEQGKKRLYKVAKQCENYGQRVQNSVFECLVDGAQWATLRGKLEKLIDPQRDSLRYYFLGDEWRSRVVHVGAKPVLDIEGPLIT